MTNNATGMTPKAIGEMVFPKRDTGSLPLFRFLGKSGVAVASAGGVGDGVTVAIGVGEGVGGMGSGSPPSPSGRLMANRVEPAAAPASRRAAKRAAAVASFMEVLCGANIMENRQDI